MLKKSQQQGNALFLILIAVALFAALSYAITQSSRGGGTISKEQTQILAAQIVQSLAGLKAAATRMVLAGVAAGDIKLHDPASSTEPCTVTDGTCLFTSDGGNAVWPVFSDNAYNQELIAAVANPALGFGMPHAAEAGDTCGGIQCGISVAGVGTSLPEVGIGLSAVSESVCLAIDKGLGHASILVEPTTYLDHVGDGYVQFNSAPGEESLCADISEAAGLDPSAGLFVYYQVLVPR